MLKSIFLSKKLKHIALFSAAILVGGISDSHASEPQLSTASTHSCMVTEAKTVECWGSNQYGQLGPNNTTGLKTQVPGLTNVLAVATGEKHTCAIIDGFDETAGEINPVKCWGNNSEGQLGNGNTVSSSTPQYVKGGMVSSNGSNILVRASAIVAGAAHTCVTTGNYMHCWGRNSSGQLGYGVINPVSPSPVMVSDKDGRPLRSSGQMVAGANHTCAVASPYFDNYWSLHCWGAGASGQLGNGSAQNSATPVALSSFHNTPSYFSEYFKFSAGNTHTCAREEDYIRCWGNWGGNTYTTPTDLYTNGVVAEIASGNNHVCAIIADTVVAGDRQVRCFGLNSDGQMGNGFKSPYVDIANWTRVEGLNSPALKIEAGGSQTCALLENGSIACWGLNGLGQLGDGTRINSVTAVAAGWWKPIAASTTPIQAISMGWSHSCALQAGWVAELQIQCWGDNHYGQLGIGPYMQESIAPVRPGIEWLHTYDTVISIASGRKHNCMLYISGKVSCWGSNQESQLGDKDLIKSYTPVPVFLGNEIATAVVVGEAHNCALMSNKKVKCWGSNLHGQLGGATSAPTSYAALEVQNLSNVIQLSAQGNHTCALLTNKTTKCWGENSLGQLGNGTRVDSPTPVDNALWINDVLKVNAGINNTCVLRAGGKVWCWGRISNLGSPKVVSSPENIAYLDQVTNISSGEEVDCAQFSNGTAKCFGFNINNLLGGGPDFPSSGNQFLPNSIRYLPAPAKQLFLGAFEHACALLEPGIVACWGNNSSGQLGNRTRTSSDNPVLVKIIQ